jgi:hypothetical protein
VGADGAALVGENREGAHRKTLEVSPTALIPSARRAAAFERAGARRRRSLARPAVDPIDEEGAAVGPCRESGDAFDFLLLFPRFRHTGGNWALPPRTIRLEKFQLTDRGGHIRYKNQLKKEKWRERVFWVEGKLIFW